MSFDIKKVDSAVPAVYAQGVESSIQKDGSYDEYDVTLSVSWSPKAGEVQTLSSRTERMSRKKFEAFREESNEYTGKKFLETYFADQWEDLQKQHKEQQTESTKPVVYVINSKTGEVSDGQVDDYPKPTVSSVATATQGKLEKPEQTTAPKVTEDMYTAPVSGSPQLDGNIEATDDMTVDEDNHDLPDADPLATNPNDPQEPEQPGKDVPEQTGTDTAEQPKAAARVKKANAKAAAAPDSSLEEKNKAAAK